MQAHRNLALGAVFAVALVVPTLTDGVFAPVISLGENSPAAVAATKSSADAQLSCSLHLLGARIVNWIAQEAAGL